MNAATVWPIADMTVTGSHVGPIIGTLWLLLLASPGIALLAAVVYFANRGLSALERGERPLPQSGVYGLTILLLLGGGGVYWMWKYFDFATRDWLQCGVGLAVALLLLCVPGWRRSIARVTDRLDAMTPRQQFWTAVAIASLVAAYLPAVAVSQGRSLLPVIHDELSYAVMARIFSTGRLWMPAHPLGASLETFYVYTSPVYGSMYFPGAGLLYAIPLAFGLPFWVGVAGVAGAFAAMLFRLTARLFTPAVGLATVIGLLGVTRFRWFATHGMSHVPLALAVLVAYWGYLRWRDTDARRWLAVFAASGAFAAVTRPYDAVLLLVIPAVIVLVRLARGERRAMGLGLLTVAACVLPFLTLQLTLNKAFTGHLLQTPFDRYFAINMPNSGFGYHAGDPQLRPNTTLVQKQEFYDSFALPLMNGHTLARVMTVDFWIVRVRACFVGAAGFPLVLLVLPVGWAALLRTRAWFMAAAAIGFFVLYTPYPYYLNWYSTGILVTLFACFWASLRPIAGLVRLSPDAVRHAAILAVVAYAIAGQPFFWDAEREQIFESPLLLEIDAQINAHVRAPALVFFRYAPNLDENASQHEPVYNLQTAWPDDAPVIRVHSLDKATDLNVLKYYQKLNGRRTVWMYDRADLTLKSYGTIDQLLAQTRPPATTQAGPATR